MGKASKMYKNAPKLERDGDSGKMAVKKSEKSMDTNESESKADAVDGGTEGVLSTEHRHAHERMHMAHKHMSEHMAMHAKHQVEHSTHEHNGHADKKEMHDRHASEFHEMHKRHTSEVKGVHAKHEKEMHEGVKHATAHGSKEKPKDESDKGAKTGEAKIEKVEKTKKD